jgi:hypothetical protein
MLKIRHLLPAGVGLLPLTPCIAGGPAFANDDLGTRSTSDARYWTGHRYWSGRNEGPVDHVVAVVEAKVEALDRLVKHRRREVILSHRPLPLPG